MNEAEHVMTVGVEECGEVAEQCLRLAKELSKGLRFGLQDRYTTDPTGPTSETGPTVQQKIVEELNDLLGVVQLMVDAKLLPADWACPEKQAAKAERVRAYMEYARKRGTVQEVAPPLVQTPDPLALGYGYFAVPHSAVSSRGAYDRSWRTTTEVKVWALLRPSGRAMLNQRENPAAYHSIEEMVKEAQAHRARNEYGPVPLQSSDAAD